MAISLPHFERFDASNDANRSARWESWLDGLQYMCGAMSLSKDTVEGDDAAKTRIEAQHAKN
jgi:hypothetical protein